MGQKTSAEKEKISLGVKRHLENKGITYRPKSLKCEVCSKDFAPKTKKQRACGRRCGFVVQFGRAPYEKSEVMNYLINTFNSLGRTPQKREIDIAYLTSARRIFGSYNKALQECNIPINSFKFQKTPVITKDGHKCDSINESYIDDWLFDHNIEHEVHVKYPGKRKFMCDFYLPTKGVWLEFLGIYGNNQYNLHYEEKLLYLKENGIHPICIYPINIKTLDQSLSFLL